MSYHFWKSVLRGVIMADIIGVIGLCLLLFGGDIVVIQFQMVGILYVVLTLCTFYSYATYKFTRQAAQVRNLNRVHPPRHL
jgi:bacteriorhodopsin